MDPLDLSHYDISSPEEPIAQNAQPENTHDNFESLGVDEGLDNLGVDESATTGKTRRPRAKMDSARILGDKGLPALQKTMLRFKFKGKGHEKRDLAKLLGTYQLWGHKLYPKANFDDFLILCRRGGRDSAIRMYRKKLIEEEKYRPLSGEFTEVSEAAHLADEPEPELEPEPEPELEQTAEHQQSPPDYPDEEEFDLEDQANSFEPDEDTMAAAMEAYQDLGF